MTMYKKILSVSTTITFLFVFLFSFGVVRSAEAQTATFPAGCSSALGYSVTTGATCNGQGSATNGPLPGCTTALGYSTTNGVPCSGGSIAISYLAGCTSTAGYSTVSGAPCNGTAVATGVNTYPTPVVTTPGLPRTGAGGNATENAILLAASGLVVALGLTYLVRSSRTA